MREPMRDVLTESEREVASTSLESDTHASDEPKRQASTCECERDTKREGWEKLEAMARG